jgi:hypothetical protein
VGLKSNSWLNGAIGTIVGDNDYKARGRDVVTLQSPAAAVAAHPLGISLSPLNLMKVMECAKLDCYQLGTNSCSGCLRQYYCSTECQKSDWKMHKTLCRLIKLMPFDMLKPFYDVESIVIEVTEKAEEKIADSETQSKIMIILLQHAASFVENQFKNRIVGTHYLRDTSERFVEDITWQIKVNMLCVIHEKLGLHTSSTDIFYFQKSL